jgi:HK97 family phage prohead protease
MNRTDILGYDSSCTRREWTVGKAELRAADNGGLIYDGIASTTETQYDVYGGAPYGWTETIAAGAFKRTLRNKADVAFLVNHEGMTLARTKSGTLQLAETDQGLHVRANLDPRMAEVNSLRIAADRGDIDEMSFGFRVVRDEWTDDNGDPSNSYEGTQRRILETNLNKGDVSAVNYGANPTTSGGFRAADFALAELRAGRELDTGQLDLVRRNFSATPGDDEILERLNALEEAISNLRAPVVETKVDDPTAAARRLETARRFQSLHQLSRTA